MWGIIATVGLAAVLFFGVGAFFLQATRNPHPGTFTVFNVNRRPGWVAVTVQVPAGSTPEQMEGWAREIAAREYPDGRGVTNFADGPPSPETFVATYQHGRVYLTRE